jgi:hypothetical protein
MTVLDAGRDTTIAQDRRLAICMPVYALTLFISALLLFWVQPMFSKMVLPLLGGTSAVWSVSMVVFQTLLLGGYVYAWFITTRLSLRLALLVHLLLLALASLSLPIAIAAGFDQPPAQGVTLWVIGLFVASVGLPCFAVSASAPLLQVWFAQTGHKQSANPYVLYGASNLGSFAVLIAYPFFIEPRWGLSEQSRLWSWGFWLLVSGIAVCGLLANAGKIQGGNVQAAQASPTAVNWSMRLRWIVLAFIPSGLLVGVTAHITTDVASAPFLWIAPLSVYLLTFILAFRARPLLPMRYLLAFQPVTLGLLAVLFPWGPQFSWMVGLGANLAAFFLAAMVCHSELYRKRPALSALTEFYAWMSAGGVLGGSFAALIAPQISVTVLEYPVLLLAAFALRPDASAIGAKAWLRTGVLVLGAAGLLTAIYLLVSAGNSSWALLMYAAVIIAAAASICCLGARPVLLFWIAATLFVAVNLFPPGNHIIKRARSFYGVYKVTSVRDGRYHLLVHGTTVHGAEDVSSKTARPEVLAYYHDKGAFWQAIHAVREKQGGSFGRVAAVGLGIGALSCYAQPGENWTYFELDPIVVKLAEDRNLFRTFSECGAGKNIVLGDARLTLKRMPAGFDLLILDAFTSDSVPAHLLTKEALALYRTKLSPHGVMVFHITNRNLSLRKVVAAAAAANGMAAWVKRDNAPSDPQRPYHANAEIAVVARSRADFAAPDGAWKAVVGDRDSGWTDDYSNILGALLEKSRQP